MIRFEIDENNCTGCKKCIAVCPEGVLELKEKKAKVIHPGLCVSCGHCAAICPAEAILPLAGRSNRSFITRPVQDHIPATEALLHKKRSIRKYKPQPIQGEEIHMLIEYGEKAPSGHNFRQREYLVVTDREKINEMERVVAKTYKILARLVRPFMIKIISLFSKTLGKELTELLPEFKLLVKSSAAGESPVFRGAPCVIITLAPSMGTNSEHDCLAAQHYMMLYGETRGLGSCIIGYAQYAHKALEKLLKVPKDKRIYTVSIFGYPQFSYPKSIYRNPPKTTWL